MSEERRRVATVTQINNYIKAIFEQTTVLGNIWIKGEISNIKFHSSGHIYLTLKDEGAVLRAVMFKSAASHMNFRPDNGTKVLARGRISVYERDGQYQLYIDEMEEEGKGDLYQRFEELKKKLAAEGLFDEAKKRPIPRFPQRVGIITSPTGAAVRDIINILRRRYGLCRAILYPCLVQGEGASKSVAEAIEYFNRTNGADVLIIGRGGGSIEDLWAFNEELTARAVAASHIPTISAVGHETDFTICDFVADLRAPTPSAAAELAVPSANELMAALSASRARMETLLKNRLGAAERHFELLSTRGVLTDFSRRIDEISLGVDRAWDNLCAKITYVGEEGEKKLAMAAASLDALSPLAILGRGYAVCTKDKEIVKSANDAEAGDEVSVVLSDGTLMCAVKDKKRSRLK